VLTENRAKFPGKPQVPVEIGNYMQTLGIDRRVKNKWLWQGMEKLGIEVLNVGENDIDELRAMGVDLQAGDRFISANLLATTSGEPLLKPYVVKQFAVKGTDRQYRLGFLGLSAREGFSNTESSGYIWGNALECAKKWLPELRQRCDFLIVLACMPARDAVQLAVDNTGIDMILTGFQHQGYGVPARISQSTLVYAEDEGRMLGELRFKVTRGDKVDAQPINYFLNREIKDEPAMAAFISQAKTEISSVQQALINTPAATKAQPTTTSGFVTSARCATCHAAAFEVWQKSRHAHAIETLKQQKKEFDTVCVTCHVTGAGKVGGFVDLARTAQLSNVQCEACHGSGTLHVENPSGAKMAKLTADACMGCHTKGNSPEFEFVTYWQKIKH
jgi:hypothetical protein